MPEPEEEFESVLRDCRERLAGIRLVVPGLEGAPAPAPARGTARFPRWAAAVAALVVVAAALVVLALR